MAMDAQAHLPHVVNVESHIPECGSWSRSVHVLTELGESTQEALAAGGRDLAPHMARITRD